MTHIADTTTVVSFGCTEPNLLSTVQTDITVVLATRYIAIYITADTADCRTGNLRRIFCLIGIGTDAYIAIVLAIVDGA